MVSPLPHMKLNIFLTAKMTLQYMMILFPTRILRIYEKLVNSSCPQLVFTTYKDYPSTKLIHPTQLLRKTCTIGNWG